MSHFPQEPRPEKKPRTAPRLSVAGARVTGAGVTSASVTGARATGHDRVPARGVSHSPPTDKRAAGKTSVHISEANMNAAVSSSPVRSVAHGDEVALSSGHVMFEAGPPLPFSERLGNGLRRTVTLGADAIVLTLASPFLLVFFTVRMVRRVFSARRGTE